MSHKTGPPGVGRSSAKFWRQVRGCGRKLVNRKTLITAFQIVLWTERIVRVVKRLVGDL
ncbi:MAG: hypothetical protein ACREHV_05935 [Rhizomicrobium sp.]